MTTPRFFDWLKSKPLIGMVHLLPLPGAPRSAGNLESVLSRALNDAEMLVVGGCHALMMENFGDAPFLPGRAPAYVATFLTRIAVELRRLYPDLPLGINILRNDGLSALAVAHAVDAAFIRVNVLTGARVTDQGLIQGIAAELMRERARLGAGDVRVLADYDVKHSAPLAPRPLADEVKDTLERGLADAVIVSGSGTGAQVELEKLRAVKAAAGDRPVLVGSGVTAATLAKLAPFADGFIVGTALKVDGLAENPVDPARVKAIVEAHRAL